MFFPYDVSYITVIYSVSIIIIVYKLKYTYFILQKQFVNGALRFVVDDFEVAKKLRNISCKITLSSGYKVCWYKKNDRVLNYLYN